MEKDEAEKPEPQRDEVETLLKLIDDEIVKSRTSKRKLERILGQGQGYVGSLIKGRITLKCNGQVRQDGDLEQMIWNVPEIISKLSEMVALEAGDIIMTGTPSGVAATVAGDTLECEAAGIPKLTVKIGPPLK